jgi:hypothetical protein
MSPRERELRSRLKQILQGLGIVRGTLAVRERACGKSGCHCQQGAKHVSLYLVASHQGKAKQLFIPKELEAQTRQWVDSYQSLRELLEELSQIYWDKLEHREP